jgi:hypothetical protein
VAKLATLPSQTIKPRKLGSLRGVFVETLNVAKRYATTPCGSCAAILTRAQESPLPQI